jgi:hypothetical protein
MAAYPCTLKHLKCATYKRKHSPWKSGAQKRWPVKPPRFLVNVLTACKPFYIFKEELALKKSFPTLLVGAKIPEHWDRKQKPGECWS